MFLTSSILWAPISLNANNEMELEYALRGKAWKVYWFLLKNGNPVSVREVQRSLRFSSPSIAYHHLEQLRELGLGTKARGWRPLCTGQRSQNWRLETLRETWKTTLSEILFLRSLFHCLLCGFPPVSPPRVYT